MELIRLTEEQFDEQFELIQNHIVGNAPFDGCMFETFGDEIEFVVEMAKVNRVITIIESDCEDDINDSGEISACMYYASGYHMVNRIGYLITTEPITEEFEVKLEW